MRKLPNAAADSATAAARAFRAWCLASAATARAERTGDDRAWATASAAVAVAQRAEAREAAADARWDAAQA